MATSLAALHCSGAIEQGNQTSQSWQYKAGGLSWRVGHVSAKPLCEAEKLLSVSLLWVQSLRNKHSASSSSQSNAHFHIC
eukprot:6488219-Amphidinium_carterae.1